MKISQEFWSLGVGAAYAQSTHNKINTKSSTESELVKANHLMPQVLQTRYFLEAQGYNFRYNIMYTDDNISILLEDNGKGYSSKRMRHTNICYLFITNWISSGDLDMEYCPTGDIISDLFTKPLQGSLFPKFCNAIINIKD